MAAGNWTFTDTGLTKLFNGTFVLGTDNFKMALFTSASNLTTASTTYAGVTGEVSATGTGYATGGIALTWSLSGTTTVTADETVNPQWTASTNGITAKWAAIYEVGGDVLCFCLLDSGGLDVTATNGNTFTVTINNSGVFTASLSA